MVVIGFRNLHLEEETENTLLRFRAIEIFFFFLFALKYNSEFYYSYYSYPASEISPITRSSGEFRVRHVESYGTFVVSYDVEFLPII